MCTFTQIRYIYINKELILAACETVLLISADLRLACLVIILQRPAARAAGRYLPIYIQYFYPYRAIKREMTPTPFQALK
jgi:hypothetical protein